MISIENWDGEIEKSIGHILDKNEIFITEEYKQISELKNNSVNKVSIIISLVIFLFMALYMIIPLFSVTLKNKSIQKYINKSSKYTYVTSITNDSNNEKAKVYKTNMSVDKTVKDIIDNVPNGITKVTEMTDILEDGIGLFTSNEYAYVYTSKEGKTYVQISNKKYLTSKNENAYHSTSSSHHYYRTYISNNSSSTYTSYAESARQSSVSSRTSSGGGTSSGK